MKKDKLERYYPSAIYSEEELFELAENIIKKDILSDFSYISSNQQLSERFIESYENYIDWYFFSIGQKLSLKLIYKYRNKIVWENLKHNRANISFPFKGKKDFITFWERKKKFSDNFIIKKMELIKNNKEILEHLIENNLLSDNMEKYLLT